MDFLDIEIDQKIVINILIVIFFIFIVHLAFTYSSMLIVKSYTLGPNTTVDSTDINMHIDVLEHDNKKLEIAGWAYKEGKPIGIVSSNYVIKNRENGKMYLMRTQMEDNINITEEEHKKAGLHAQCLLFGIPRGTYDIYVLYQNDGIDVLADTLISVDL